ncbi:MAG: hypothetical protein HY593_03000 [Candidatus Omnitrophica bacterium]|nr:hypothetical protein [Candidatus Omnitrophota bacterium]
MKKLILAIVMAGSFVCVSAYAQEAAQKPEEAVPAETAAVPQAEEPAAPGAPAAEGTVVEEPSATENLEFVSGEVSGVDEAAKTITVKLYGETEGETAEKMLTVNVDENTDITDGEKDRELKSLTAGTEVDVEYDPASKKATYVFVY